MSGVKSLLLLLFQTNAEQQTKIQDLQEKLSKVDRICDEGCPHMSDVPTLRGISPLTNMLSVKTSVAA